MRAEFHLLIACALALATLAGCAGTSSTTSSSLDVVSQDARFTVVRLRENQSLEQLASVALNDAGEVWQIRAVNPGLKPAAGALVAIPRVAANPTGVTKHAYYTLPILCYHQFTHSAKASQQLELTAKDFEAQLRFLVDGGYQVLSFAEAADVINGRRPMPEKGVVLTIDDGYKSVYDVAWPLLQKYKLPATLFIYTDFVGGGDALSWQEISEMKDSGLIEIESHGKSHASLSRTSVDVSDAVYRERLQAELAGSEQRFKQRLGDRPRYLSYPYGNSSETISSMLEVSGYGLAATVTRGPNGSFVDPFLVHRTMIYADHSLDEFAKFVESQRRRRAP